MRLLIAALTLFAGNVLLVLYKAGSPTAIVSLLAKLDRQIIIQVENSLLPLLSAFIVLESIILLSKRRKETTLSDDKSSAPNSTVTQLEQQLAQAVKSAEKAKALSSARNRPETVDAELINLLATFQEKGRFIDFLMEDITAYSEAQVTAAARVVHQGCSGALREYFAVQTLVSQSEGSLLTLDKNYNPRQFRLLGQIKGEPPFSGKLIHRGWIAQKASLPRIANLDPEAANNKIIAPAEVELS